MLILSYAMRWIKYRLVIGFKICARDRGSSWKPRQLSVPHEDTIFGEAPHMSDNCRQEMQPAKVWFGLRFRVESTPSRVSDSMVL